MKDHANRIISIIFIALSTLCVCFLCYRSVEGKQFPADLRVAAVDGEISAFSQEEDTSDVNSTLTETQADSETTVPQEKGLTVTYPDSAKINVKKQVITVKGNCDLQYKPTINGKEIETDGKGNFSYDYLLMLGDNEIEISNGNVTYTYIVRYTLQVIFDVSPSGNLNLDGDEKIELVAYALRGAEVYAEINSVKVPMSPVDEGNSEKVNYKGEFNVPSSLSIDKYLGKIVFRAKYSDNDDSMTGAGITVKAYKPAEIVIEQGKGVVVPPEISDGNVVELLSPQTDHGKGKSRMCTVKADFAETVSASANNDKSNPRYTPELKGTIDYITGEGTYDGTPYYKLLSGVMVEQKKVNAFDGYVMPANTISVYKSYVGDGYTNAVLTMNWKAPFVADLKPQSYFRGYEGREFNVNSFTAEYIDFVFKFTNAAEGSFDFSGSSVVSSAEFVNIGKDGSTTLRVHLKNKGKFYGYKAYYSSDNRLVIQFKECPDKSSPVVVIDPGHGGKDCGAIAVNGTYEALINLRIAGLVKQKLEAEGCRVYILRTGNVFISKDDRQKQAKTLGGDIFVSVHCNSSESSSLSGTEVYYYRAFSKALASSVHGKLVSAWKEIYADNSAMQSRIVPKDGGVRFNSFRVTRVEECPAILIECGYLSNPTEGEKLCTENVQDKIASAIAKGIIDYFANL